jgi:hypothetical protein
MLYKDITDEEYNQEQHDYYNSYLEDIVDYHVNNG